MLELKRCAHGAVGLFLALVCCSTMTHAQHRTQSAFGPGDTVGAEQVASRGKAGRALAALVGVRPVLLVFWRPGDSQSEQALAIAARYRASHAESVAVVAPAVLAAGQRESAIASRRNDLGLAFAETPADNGSLARAFGVTRVPTIALIDTGGVLRTVGGSSVLQETNAGVSVLDAMMQAHRGETVPMLGVMPSRPVYRLLGKKVPTVAVTEPDGKTWHKVSDFLEPDKRMMLFYWSPSCPHCRKALPKLKEWYAAKPDDVVLIDLARADSAGLRKEWGPLIEDAPWTHLLDPQHLAGRTLLVTETPTTFLLGADGEVLSIQVGGDVDWSAWTGRGVGTQRP